jgi:hypothetical protein
MSKSDKYEHFIDEARKQLQEYVNLKLELARIDLQAATARTVSHLFSGLLILFFVFMMVLFASVATGFYLSEKMDSFVNGFGIVAAAYVIFFIVLLIIRKNVIQRKVADTIISLINRDND